MHTHIDIYSNMNTYIYTLGEYEVDVDPKSDDYIEREDEE
jgi:hypothetical protein